MNDGIGQSWRQIRTDYPHNYLKQTEHYQNDHQLKASANMNVNDSVQRG